MTAVITVKKSGSDNLARVAQWNIRASCTSSAKDAVTRSLAKLADRTNRDPGHAILRRMSDTLREETWLVTWPEGSES